MSSLAGGRIGLLIVANLAIFVLGFFLDFFEIAFIIIPLLAPAAALLGIDLVWFGVMIAWDEHPDLVPDPALRLRPLLSAGRGSTRSAHIGDVPGGHPLHRDDRSRLLMEPDADY